jgi:hypothetical protein
MNPNWVDAGKTQTQLKLGFTVVTGNLSQCVDEIPTEWMLVKPKLSWS